MGRSMGGWIAAVATAAALAASTPVQAADVALGTCGWPVRVDPTLINALLPDEDALYHVAALPAAPPGTHYRITGRFPHARYISFAAYNGVPIDAIADVEIDADAGATNPFLPLADRTLDARGYTIEVLEQPKPAAPAERSPGTLYVGQGQLGTPTTVRYLVYRLYLADAGTDLRGGVEVPVIRLVDDTTGLDVQADAGVLPCEATRDFVPGQKLAELQRDYAHSSPPPPPVGSQQATNPPRWEADSGAGNIVFSAIGEGDMVTGGPGGNPHTVYVQTRLTRAHGPVLAIRAKAPSTPTTGDGSRTMSELTDLRYFSFCQSSPTTRSIGCLNDEELVRDPDGTFTIAVSTPADRPATARNWIPFGPEPTALMLYRHMLPSAAFYPFSAQNVAATGAPIEATMGPYFPRAVYCTTAQFDADRCGLG